MSFKLRILFTGLCVFRENGQKAMYVFLPSTQGKFPMPVGADMELDPHSARLTFDTAHLSPQGVTPDGYLAHVMLGERTLTLPEANGALNTALPSDLVTIGKLKREVYDDRTARSLLTARITLLSGQCTGVAPGRCWKWNNKEQRMSHVVEWTIDDYPGSSLTLQLVQFSGINGAKVGPLYPIDGEVTLTVWHAAYTDLPPDPLPVAEPDLAHPPTAHHFAALLRLVEDASRDLPVFAGNSCSQSSQARDELDNPGGKGAAAVSCMGGHGG
ncbi:MAG: hypothetical protein JWM27_2844 [Gemmatimonadetes bacterium]|nr:hypothetical protein [Gemmatimonadota bacterium]